MSVRSKIGNRKSEIANRQSAIGNRQSEIGATLVEVLVAVAIIASALVVFIAALSTGAFAVRSSDRLTTADNLAASQLEMIKAAPYNPGGYAAISAPAGFSVTVASNELAAGLQQVTVTVSYDGDQLAVISNYKVDR